MAWFKKQRTPLEPPEEKRVRTEGLFIKCDGCRQIVWKKDLEANWNVCPKCSFHFKMDARARLRLLFDGEWKEHDGGLSSNDPLSFVDLKPYRERLERTRKTTGLCDALVSAEGQ